MPHLAGLNAAQLAAVTTVSDVVQVLAPPGSGKTKTLTARVAHLLAERNYKPWNVICLTFTIKSAREMKERLGRLLGEGFENKLVLGTFHSVCRRYLASYGHLIGLRKGFGIADSSDTVGIINRIVKRHNLPVDPRQARSRISSCKAKNIRWEQLLRETTGKKEGVDRHQFGQVYQYYEEHLETSNLLDYDDLLLRCLELLQKFPACVSNVQAVLIDEFQDTNSVQFDLMCLFAQHCQCITTVGDPDQSIYGWRNAEASNLGKMQRLWPDTLIINLENNYRSAGSILTSAQAVIEQDLDRHKKALIATHCDGTSPVLRKLPTASIEGEWIVSEIKRSMCLSAGLLLYSDYSVLLRSAALSRQVESAMGKAGIPYRMVGGVRFYDRIEVKILLDYVRVIAQPDNSDALSRIINVPSRKIGEQTIRSLLEEATRDACTMWSILRKAVRGEKQLQTKLTTKQDQSLGSLVHLITTARNKLEDTKGNCSPDSLLEFVIEKLEFRDYLAKEYKQDYEIRWENIGELVAQAADPSYRVDEQQRAEDALPEIDGIEQECSPSTIESLSKFLANVALATEIQSTNDTDDTGITKSKVTISTIHAAKGLEWPIVFIPACYQGSMPHSRADDTDEERRLLYVAMTRAQAMLYMSCPLRASTGNETALSSFLTKPKVKANLKDCGPLFEFRVIEDIATILSRESPPRERLTKAIGEAENVTDDRWPLSGKFDAEEIGKQRAGEINSYGYRTAMDGFKRQRVSGENSHNNDGDIKTTMYTSTTMQKASSFTIPANANMGFVTAARQMEIQREAAPTPSEQTEIPNAADSDKLNKSRITKRGTGQASLISFFSNGRGKEAETLATAPVRVTSSTDSALQTGSSSILRLKTPNALDRAHLNHSRSEHRQPVAPVPATTMNGPSASLSSLAPARKPIIKHVDTHAGRQRPIYLSSSPSPEPTKGDVSGVEDVSSDPVQPIRKCSSVEALTTIHNTTLGRLKSGSGKGPPRRTLGIARGFVPWSARGGRGAVATSGSSRPFHG